ncbi:MAG: LysR family transcriptional regulator [Alphaproteobacteria bacterium]
MQTIDWNDLRHVLAVARAGQFVGAGRLVGSDGTTVARRIAAIEGALGARLFDRSASGGLVPTEAGEVAISRAERVEREVAGLETIVAGTDSAIAGTVRVTSVPVLTNRVLVPASAVLSARHPALRIELVAEPRNLSLTRREADIALRLARPDPGAGARTVARRIGRLAHAVYGPIGTAEPSRLPWVTYEEAMAGLPTARWIARAIAAEGAAAAPVSVNDAEGALQAAQAGIGRTCLPTVVGDRANGLARLADPPNVPPLVRDLWLMVHPDLRGLGRIAATIGWLDGLFAAG